MIKTLNFAHRGFSGKYPENTMLAFEKAVLAGADGIELDVQLSADGIPVVIHDEDLNRLCGKSRLVKDMTFAELQNLRIGDEKIPSLEEYLDFIKNTKLVSNIELKTGIFEYIGIEKRVCSLLKKYSVDERCIISSFNYESILRVKKIANYLVCGFLTDSWEINPVHTLKLYGIECYHPCAYRLTKKFVEYLHSQNIRVNAWFGSIQTDYSLTLLTGLDGIITDYPDKIAGLAV